MLKLWLLCLIGNSLSPGLRPSHNIITDLGILRVTRYTWHEGGKWAASGHRFNDRDVETVCAVSRDLRKKLWGEYVSIPSLRIHCRIIDVMGIRNSRGLRQRRWIDVYSGSDVSTALDFGIQRHKVYHIRRY